MDAPEVERTAERAVTLNITAAEVAQLAAASGAGSAAGGGGGAGGLFRRRR